jgi:hypothetical protein
MFWRLSVMSKVNNTLVKFREKYVSVCQSIGAAIASPSKRHAQFALFLVGVALIGAGLSMDAIAQGTTGGRAIRYNDARVTQAVNGVLLYLEGSFGALVMVASGIGAIMSAAFGQYRAALGLMVVAVGAFILRSLMSTFFNDQNIQQ